MNIITDKCIDCDQYRIDPDVVPFCGMSKECTINEPEPEESEWLEIPLFLRDPSTQAE